MQGGTNAVIMNGLCTGERRTTGSPEEGTHDQRIRVSGRRGKRRRSGSRNHYDCTSRELQETTSGQSFPLLCSAFPYVLIVIMSEGSSQSLSSHSHILDLDTKRKVEKKRSLTVTHSGRVEHVFHTRDEERLSTVGEKKTQEHDSRTTSPGLQSFSSVRKEWVSHSCPCPASVAEALAREEKVIECGSRNARARGEAVEGEGERGRGRRSNRRMGCRDGDAVTRTRSPDAGLGHNNDSSPSCLPSSRQPHSLSIHCLHHDLHFLPKITRLIQS